MFPLVVFGPVPLPRPPVLVHEHLLPQLLQLVVPGPQAEGDVLPLHPVHGLLQPLHHLLPPLLHQGAPGLLHVLDCVLWFTENKHR